MAEACGQPTPEQIFTDMNCSPRVIHIGAEEKCEEEGAAERNHHVQTIPTPATLHHSGWVEESGLKK